jgi:hypothetical protein
MSRYYSTGKTFVVFLDNRVEATNFLHFAKGSFERVLYQIHLAVRGVRFTPLVGSACKGLSGQ